jgi:hypothetical protein
MITKKSLHRIGAAGVVSLASVLGTAGRADAEAINLFIKNGDTQSVKVTLQTDNNNCYESNQTALGQTWTIKAGDQVKMFFWRVGGHGCNGKQGEFQLAFDPPAGDYKTAHFDYDNDGGLQVSGNQANVYPGKLVPKSPQDNGDKTYTFVTDRLHEPITSGNAVGSWLLICSNNCNYQHVHTVETTSTTTKTYTDEEKNAIKSSLESKMEFEGIGSVTAGITNEYAKTVARQMSDSLQRGETFSDADNYVFTPEQMRDLNIFAIWQWVAETSLSNGSVAEIRSRSFTCTPDGHSPQYLPGASEAVKACHGG